MGSHCSEFPRQLSYAGDNFNIWKIFMWGKGTIPENRSCVNFIAIQPRGKKPWRRRAVYTWQNCQPCRVKGYPNRITRQARIFPSILKSYIPNIENPPNFFVRQIVITRLENKKAREKAERHRNDCGEAMELWALHRDLQQCRPHPGGPIAAPSTKPTTRDTDNHRNSSPPQARHHTSGFTT